MLRVAIAGFVLATASAAMSTAALAQWGWGYDDRPFRRYPYPYQYQNPYYGQSYQNPSYGRMPRDFFWDDERPRRPMGPSFRSGGPRPEIAPVAPSRIAFPSTF